MHKGIAEVAGLNEVVYIYIEGRWYTSSTVKAIQLASHCSHRCRKSPYLSWSLQLRGLWSSPTGVCRFPRRQLLSQLASRALNSSVISLWDLQRVGLRVSLFGSLRTLSLLLARGSGDSDPVLQLAVELLPHPLLCSWYLEDV